MKIRNLASLFFAAYGMFLALTGVFALIPAIYSISLMGRYVDEEGSGAVIAQYAINFVPSLVGVTIALCARWLGRLTARLAGLPDHDGVALSLDARELLAVLLVGIGVYLAITQSAELVRLALLIFQARAGNKEVSEAAVHRLPDGSQALAQLVCVIAGVVLIKNAGRVSNGLLNRASE